MCEVCSMDVCPCVCEWMHMCVHACVHTHTCSILCPSGLQAGASSFGHLWQVAAWSSCLESALSSGKGTGRVRGVFWAGAGALGHQKAQQQQQARSRRLDSVPGTGLSSSPIWLITYRNPWGRQCYYAHFMARRLLHPQSHTVSKGDIHPASAFIQQMFY